MKNIKKHLERKHGKNFQDCHFDIKEFNTHKRKLSVEEALTANKPTKGGGKGHNPPPPPPPAQAIGVILLTFTGYTVTGTSWNASGDIVCSPANLTSAQVDEIVANIEGEYALYNVTITTDEAIYNASPINRRTRCIFTESWEWFGQAGGVAFVGSFSDGYNNPCFVFTTLLSYSAKYIKEAAAHEIGHTCGLYHQSKYDANCVLVSQYNSGGCPLTCGEAPIMGVSYSAPDTGTKWWIGPTPYGCQSIQDDNAILTANLGLK